MIARGMELRRCSTAVMPIWGGGVRQLLVSILLVSPTEESRHGAAPSLPRATLRRIDGGLIGPRSGACGTAAYRGERVIVLDIMTDPLWDQYRHLAIDMACGMLVHAHIFHHTAA